MEMWLMTHLHKVTLDIIFLELIGSLRGSVQIIFSFMTIRLWIPDENVNVTCAGAVRTKLHSGNGSLFCFVFFVFRMDVFL